MKTIKQKFALIDEYGNGVDGKEVWFYPIGTTNHGTKATEISGKKGQYEIEIDPTSDSDKISHYYDVWYDGALQYSKVALRDKWIWFCTKQITAAEQDVQFSGCTDENGDNLPGSIPNAIVGLMSFSKGRLFYISYQDNTKITVKAQDFADDDCVNLATNPVTISFFVTIKAKTS